MSLSNDVDERRDRPMENVPRPCVAVEFVGLVLLGAATLGSGKLVRDRDNMIRFAGAPEGVVEEEFGSSKVGMCGLGINVGLVLD